MVKDAGVRTLVLGGARSGKSAFAEELAGRAGAVRYVATAVVDPSDADFAERVAAHRVRRPGVWNVVEGDPVALLAEPAPVTLVDDLGTWLTGRINARAAWEQPRGTVRPDIDDLVAAVTGYQHRLIIVSPEVGLGVLPATRSGRLFQDELGELNQRLAAVCDEVYLVVAGIPTRIKPNATVEGAPGALVGAAAPGGVVNDAARTVSESPSSGEGVGPAGSAHDDGGTDASARTVVTGSGSSGAGEVQTAGGVDGVDTGERTSEFSGAAPEFGPVVAPDAQVRGQAEARQLELTKPGGALGRLETLGNWVAACQGVCPPRQFQRARVVVFAGDHGVARHGVSAYPSEVTAQMVANFLAGGAAVNVLARLADATVRVVDIAVDGDTDPSVSTYKIRRSSGRIDREDALTEAEVNAALAAGKAIADEEIDGGADLLIAGDMGIGNTTPATVLIATLTDTEPVLAVGRGTGIDDAGWMRKAAAVRDAMWRARSHRHDPAALLRVAGGADLAAAAGYLAQAAARRTLVILDGVVITAAALLADMLAPGAKAWWVAGHRSTEPSHARALDRLGLEPLVDLGMRLGEGSGALTALPVLRAAVSALTDMATFADAGVSTADETTLVPSELTP
ncbi:nicotinate-nucleotide--dimethylbenzimidazole phosphoribosyltransferase [Nocardia sp. N2S4-5]|uniref:nicotinate-nucleotide--dimethylbenzimidazole phosphoribosyltransferase n=1 Tax=Nocardia sp. N2S4-5 TaxID=3351565 RepID=UPI0037D07DFF